jgi:ATP-dependent Clp protease adaptor protein ClpS
MMERMKRMIEGPKMSAGGAVAAPPREQKRKRVQRQDKTMHVPRFHVVLLDDNDHTYEYVIEMLMVLFGHSMATAFRMACEVDLSGRVVVDTCHKERAELKRDQIHTYGADPRISHCKGPMSATIEPAP